MRRATAPRVFVIGAGRAGSSLAGAWRAAGVNVVGLRRRGGSWRSLPRASVVVIAVQDRALPRAIAELVRAPVAPGAVVLHTSGGTDARAAFAPLRREGHPTGTFHPLVPLPNPRSAAERLRGAWIGIEGDPAAARVARALARSLGARTLLIPVSHRVAYHAAAVLASNFPVVLAAAAEDVMVRSGVPRRTARGVIEGLQRAVIGNLAGGVDPVRALTGPVARGDRAVIPQHLAALRGDPAVADAYRALTRLATRLATRLVANTQAGRRPAPRSRRLA